VFSFILPVPSSLHTYSTLYRIFCTLVLLYPSSFCRCNPRAKIDNCVLVVIKIEFGFLFFLYFSYHEWKKLWSSAPFPLPRAQQVLISFFTHTWFINIISNVTQKARKIYWRVLTFSWNNMEFPSELLAGQPLKLESTVSDTGFVFVSTFTLVSPLSELISCSSLESTSNGI
jgi:hypothetical protein